MDSHQYLCTESESFFIPVPSHTTSTKIKQMEKYTYLVAKIPFDIREKCV